MRVALTGANGFTGRYVTAALDAAGVAWTSLEADLRDPAAVERTVAETAFDSLVHLAGHAFVGAPEWPSFYAVNQLGTLHLLNAVARARPGARCILASSAQVYGPGAEGLIGEDAPANPNNHYSISKFAMELGAALSRGQLDIVVTRPFNYTGVGQGIDYLIPKIVDHFRRRADVIELGNTWVERDFGDVRSVAEAYVGLVLAETVPSVANICTGTVHSIGAIMEMLGGISGHSLEIRVNPAFVRANDVAVLGGDSARLRAALPGWRPRALLETLEWMYWSPAEQRP
jgi:nucleoside-diphosphate-sugar epimerase